MRSPFDPTFRRYPYRNRGLDQTVVVWLLLRSYCTRVLTSEITLRRGTARVSRSTPVIEEVEDIFHVDLAHLHVHCVLYLGVGVALCW